MGKRAVDADEAERYGFRWGQLDVIRNMDARGIKSLSIITDHTEIQIGVSAGGRRIRVFKNGTEMK